ncbi:hypothetical protein CRE_09475 [Caenorhabditis remanei]|uniref:SCP domain-containing protein n=1 Tax=Caenorhabditis remanei TaxID=31234 RepID=E3LJ47_CAERE|nr:hypothetical protein CRE_09475 [Caenorhabditis remanei]
MKTAIIFLALIAGISAQFSATAQQQNNGIPPSELPPKTTQTPVQLDTLEQLDSKRISSGVGLAESLEPSIHMNWTYYPDDMVVDWYSRMWNQNVRTRLIGQKLQPSCRSLPVQESRKKNVLNKPIYKQGATCSACPSPTKCDTSSGLCV